MWPRDPFSVTARWGVRHRQVAAWIAAVAFVALVVYPPTRWGVVVTLWAILGVGLLVALILEEHAEPIQRRVWLRRNVRTVEPVVGQLVRNVGLVLASTVGLPIDISDPLRVGKTFRERRQAAELAREMISGFIRGNPPAHELIFVEYSVWLSFTKSLQGLVDASVSANQPLMDRIVEVHTAANELHMFSTMAAATYPPGVAQSEIETFQRMIRGQFAEWCLAMCEHCNAVLNEAGVIEG
jgi:hypothetical protein